MCKHSLTVRPDAAASSSNRVMRVGKQTLDECNISGVDIVSAVKPFVTRDVNERPNDVYAIK